MSNYVYSKVICSKETFENYFRDSNPFGDDRDLDYVTFNQLCGVSSIQEYSQEYGSSYIYYGDGWVYKEIDKKTVELMFTTRWEYPINAILRAVDLDRSLKWYLVEENCIYISCFYWWNGMVKEAVCNLETDHFDDWYTLNELYTDTDREDAEHFVWDYLSTIDAKWKIWPSGDHFKRYLNTPVCHIDKFDFALLSEAEGL